MIFFKNKFYLAIQLITILAFLLLPYYLFQGKLFIGGDDSRLFYIYPWEWINNIAFYSWFHFSVIGTNNPNQFILPFLYIWSLVSFLVRSKVILDYLSFSLPLILGFIYFQKFAGELLDDKNKVNGLVYFVGTLIYTLSPIISYNQLAIFLYSAWLIGLLPIISYYFLKYLKTGDFTYVFINTIWCVVLSFAVGTIPWLLGYLLPLVLSLFILIPLFYKKEIVIFIRRSIIFFAMLLFSQAFWVYSFIINTIFPEKNSFLGIVLSKNSTDTFSETVLSTASGNIFYPLLNLFHRQLTMDYKSPLQAIFFSFYDKTIIFDTIFALIIFAALFLFKKYFNGTERKIYLFFFVAFLVSLFLFTVNIGPLKGVFLLMGHLPGFIMFRNFYDKFALGYTLIFSILVTLSIVVISRKYTKVQVVISLIVLFVVLLNVIPIKDVINKKLWTTNSTYSVATFSDEYFNFMQQVKNTVPQTSNILSLPFNIAGYTIVKDESTDNVFAGRSPVELLTGTNDFSGNLSFSPISTARFVNDIKKRNYLDLNEFLKSKNISYIFVTNNIPQEVKHSYLFDKKILPYQDNKLLQAITGERVIISTNGNYVLYKTKYPTSLFQANNLNYQKVNPVTFQLQFNNLRTPQQLGFLDSFSGGWKLFPEIFAAHTNNEFSYLFKKDIFADSHKVLSTNGNQWIIDPTILKNNFPLQYYHINPDGSIDVKLTLYFKPQENFYIGTLISLLTLLLNFSYLIYVKRKIIQ